MPTTTFSLDIKAPEIIQVAGNKQEFVTLLKEKIEAFISGLPDESRVHLKGAIVSANIIREESQQQDT